MTHMQNQNSSFDSSARQRPAKGSQNAVENVTASFRNKQQELTDVFRHGGDFISDCRGMLISRKGSFG